MLFHPRGSPATFVSASVIFVLVYFFVLVFVLVFANYFLVLVSFQFYSIGDFYKYVMMSITSHRHILLN